MTYKPLHNPFKIVAMFEEEVANYTGAPYAVAVNSCTSALFLCCTYLKVKEVIIPKHTYLSVPQSIIHAGGYPIFKDIEWGGMYQLKPYPIYDSARRLTSVMYIEGSFICLSFHIKKTLKIGKGGMILTDSLEAAQWFKRMRYEGRTELPLSIDEVSENGWNMYMTPQEAAHGLALMQNIPLNNPDVEEDILYRDLTEFPLFKSYERRLLE
jgi:dTDP-4-amino-4,6-dideoxygalactose transaminase